MKAFGSHFMSYKIITEGQFLQKVEGKRADSSRISATGEPLEARRDGDSSATHVESVLFPDPAAPLHKNSQPKRRFLRKRPFSGRTVFR
ncbi:hypothetical protein D479_16062 [Halobacillus sp. BAB-2008]|nr:hypothetical protein D479_16062 [Halobacillus sp. BAB-2008]